MDRDTTPAPTLSLWIKGKKVADFKAHTQKEMDELATFANPDAAFDIERSCASVMVHAAQALRRAKRADKPLAPHERKLLRGALEAGLTYFSNILEDDEAADGSP